MTVHKSLLLCITISVLCIHVSFKCGRSPAEIMGSNLAYYDDNLNKWSTPFTLFVNQYSYLTMAEIGSQNMKYN